MPNYFGPDGTGAGNDTGPAMDDPRDAELARLRAQLAEAEAEIKALAAPDPDDPDDADIIGHLLVDTVSNRVNDGAWHDEFREWYKPGEWLGSHRAAASFLAGKFAASEAKLALLVAALTPTAETKAAYMGEFTVPMPIWNKDGSEVMCRINVPWTTIKDIMAVIRTRATIGT